MIWAILCGLDMPQGTHISLKTPLNVLGTAQQEKAQGLNRATCHPSLASMQVRGGHQLLRSKPKTVLQENSSSSAAGQPVKNGFWSLGGAHGSFLLIKQIFFQSCLGFHCCRWPKLLARHWRRALKSSTDQRRPTGLSAK